MSEHISEEVTLALHMDGQMFPFIVMLKIQRALDAEIDHVEYVDSALKEFSKIQDPTPDDLRNTIKDLYAKRLRVLPENAPVRANNTYQINIK